jgi:hypothetical protein
LNIAVVLLIFVIDGELNKDFNGVKCVGFGDWVILGCVMTLAARELQNALIGVNFGHVAGIQTPARVETIDKEVDLEAECVPNG